MRIAIHAATLRGLGSALVGKRILSHIAGDTSHDFRAWVPAEWTNVACPRVRLEGVDPGVGSKWLVENVTIRAAIRRWRADRLLSLSDTTLPMPGVPSVLLIQQAYLAYPPREWGFSAPTALRLRFAAAAAYLRMSLPSISMFVVQSEAMRRRLASRWGIGNDHIQVIPSAPDHRVWDPVASVTRRCSRSGGYVACLTGAGPHKNLDLLPDVLALLRRVRPGVLLRLTVWPEQVPGVVRCARDRGVLGALQFTGPLRADDVPLFLENAAVVLFPSKLESFGIGYYEALAAGCPTIAADRDFAREALGDAAIYVDADSAAATATELDRLLGDDAACRDLAERAKARYWATRIAWSEIAAQYIAVMERL